MLFPKADAQIVNTNWNVTVADSMFEGSTYTISKSLHQNFVPKILKLTYIPV